MRSSIRLNMMSQWARNIAQYAILPIEIGTTAAFAYVAGDYVMDKEYLWGAGWSGLTLLVGYGAAYRGIRNTLRIMINKANE